MLHCNVPDAAVAKNTTGVARHALLHFGAAIGTRMIVNCAAHALASAGAHP
jgi:hypothetical protein